jgi:hypothetical protein
MKAKVNIHAGASIYFVGDYAPSITLNAPPQFFQIFKKRDIIIINYEGVSSTFKPNVSQPYYTPMVESGFLKHLTELGVLVCANLANNHSLDYGIDGLEATIADLCSIGVLPFGVKHPKCSLDLELYSKTFTFNLFPLVSRSLVNHFPFSYREYYRTNAPHDIIRSSSVANILLTHDGVEFVDYPDPLLFHKFSNFYSSFDCIINTHQHVALPVITSGNRLLAYSLGNFLFDCPLHEHQPLAKAGLMLEFSQHGRLCTIHKVNSTASVLQVAPENKHTVVDFRYSYLSWFNAVAAYSKLLRSPTVEAKSLLKSCSLGPCDSPPSLDRHKFFSILFYYCSILFKPNILLFKVSRLIALLITV